MKYSNQKYTNKHVPPLKEEIFIENKIQAIKPSKGHHGAKSKMSPQTFVYVHNCNFKTCLQQLVGKDLKKDEIT